MITIKFRVNGDREFDTIVNATQYGLYLSQEGHGGEQGIKLERGVLYTNSDEFVWVTLNYLTIPKLKNKLFELEED